MKLKDIGILKSKTFLIRINILRIICCVSGIIKNRFLQCFMNISEVCINGCIIYRTIEDTARGAKVRFG